MAGAPRASRRRRASAGARTWCSSRRDRLGGPIDTRTDPVLGIALEHGADFVHGRPERTLALAARARIREVPDRRARRVRGGLTDATDAFAAAQEILGRGTRDDEPFAAACDAVRREGRFDRAALEMADAFVRGFYLADPRTASSRALARLTRALDEIGGDVTCRIDGGYARVLDPLSRSIRSARAEVRLSTCVRRSAGAGGTSRSVRATLAVGGSRRFSATPRS